MRAKHLFASLSVVSIVSCTLDLNRDGSNEMIAAGTISRLVRAELTFYARFHRYGSLPELVAQSDSGLDPGLNAGRYGNYVFALEIRESGFAIVAKPVDSYSRRSFYADETGVIRHSWKPDDVSANSPKLQ